MADQPRVPAIDMPSEGTEDYYASRRRSRRLSRDEISSAAIKEYQKTFEFFDRDKDGLISCKELGSVMRSLGQNPTDNELQDMVHEVDKNGNGVIDFSEFVLLMSRRGGISDQREEIKAAFTVFDKNKSGTLTREDVVKILKSLGEDLSAAEVDEVMKDLDQDKDGLVTLEDFYRTMLD